MTYLDFVVLVKDSERASALGEKYNQIGMFWLKESKYIEIGGSGEDFPDLPSLLDRFREIEDAT